MNPLHDRLLDLSRRQFFSRTAGTMTSLLGTAALGRLLGGPLLARNLFGSSQGAGIGDPQRGVLGGPHHAPKAKRVIYLFMSGGPSHHDLWDYKPKLNDMFGEQLPDHVRDGQRVIESAFLSLEAMGRRHYGWLPVRLLLRLHFDNGAKVALRLVIPEGERPTITIAWMRSDNPHLLASKDNLHVGWSRVFADDASVDPAQTGTWPYALIDSPIAEPPQP